MKITQPPLFQSPTLTTRGPSLPVSLGTSSKNPPDLALTAGLHKKKLLDEGIYLLRTLAHQYNRNLSNDAFKKKFMAVIQTEIALKRGGNNPTLLLMNVLLQRHCSKN